MDLHFTPTPCAHSEPGKELVPSSFHVVRFLLVHSPCRQALGSIEFGLNLGCFFRALMLGTTFLSQSMVLGHRFSAGENRKAREGSSWSLCPQGLDQRDSGSQWTWPEVTKPD